MPCSPGLTPVMMELQATEDISGIDDSICLKTPSLASLPTFGIVPFVDKSSIKRHGTPSRPIMIVRFLAIALLIDLDSNGSTSCQACHRVNYAVDICLCLRLIETDYTILLLDALCAAFSGGGLGSVGYLPQVSRCRLWPRPHFAGPGSRGTVDFSFSLTSIRLACSS